MLKSKKLIALLAATCVSVSGLPVMNVVNVMAEPIVEPDRSGFSYLTGEYKYVWGDEFENGTLNRDDWNVETHEKGWVNSELQEYVDSEDNISITEDGKLKITPLKLGDEDAGEGEGGEDAPVPRGELLINRDLTGDMNIWYPQATDGAAASFNVVDNKLECAIENGGTSRYHVQLGQAITLKKGLKYTFGFKAESDIDCSISASLDKDGYAAGDNDYSAIKTEYPWVETGKVNTYSYDYVATADNEFVKFNIKLGTPDGNAPYASHTVKVYDFTVVEATNDVSPAIKGNIIKNADFSAGADVEWDNEAGSNTCVLEGNKLKYTISNTGSNWWDIQLKQNLTGLRKNKNYTVKFKVESSIERQIGSSIQHDGTDGNYNSYGSGEYPRIPANTETEVSYDVLIDDEGNHAMFQVSLGAENATMQSALSGTHTIYLYDFSIQEKPSAIEGIENSDFTSGRISTQNKHAFTYGIFECKAKVPSGAGYLPAFWLMANDENVYGQWPRCGEIDCMEVMGQEPDKLYGTIHFGNPHSESQGTIKTAQLDSPYKLKDFSEDYHTFACEWLPGKIIWYVDGKKFHEEQNWYSTTEGVGRISYPAPFDQPFYIILNLAVGGSWVGNPDSSTEYGEGNEYFVDYVRVYQKDDYDENVTEPERVIELRDPDGNGNYINNGNFSPESLTDDVNWKFMTALDGEATAVINENAIEVTTTNQGTVDYSVQLVQAGVPLLKGAKYEVSFDAQASAERTMNVDIKAPDHGYKPYMKTLKPLVTTEKQSFSTQFVMKDDTDGNGRLEFNMGVNGTETLKISNVSIKKIADPDESAPEDKVLLMNGNYIYNGKFQEGDRRLGGWNIEAGDSENYTVTGYSDNRRLKVKMSDGAENPFVLSQDDLAFESGLAYSFRIDVQSDTDTTIDVNIGGLNVNLPIAAGDTAMQYGFDIPSSTAFDNSDISISVNNGTVLLDNIILTENALIKNGSFDGDMACYETYSSDDADADFEVIDGVLNTTIKNTADQDWKVQVKQNNVKLEKGSKYRLKFDAKSTIDRDVRVIMQGQIGTEYPIYSHTIEDSDCPDGVVSVGNEWKTYSHEFTMTHDTNENAYLSICMGMLNNRKITTSHVVSFDNISLEKVIDKVEIIAPTPVPVVFDPKTATVKGNNTDTIELGKASKNGKVANSITKLTVDPSLTGTVTVIKGSTITTTTALDTAPVSSDVNTVKVKYNKAKKIAMFKAAKAGSATIDYGNGHKLTINVTEPKLKTKSVKAVAGGTPVELTIDGDIDTYAWNVAGKYNEKSADGSIIVKDKKGNVVATVVTAQNVAKVIPGAVKGNVKVSAVYLNKKYNAKVKISDK